MKIKNILSVACLSLALGAGLASCSEEHAEYTAAEVLANAQVYFSPVQTAVSNVDLKEGESVCNIVLSRANVEGECTVKLDVKQTGFASSSETLSIPASVTFAAGDSLVNIPLAYDATKLEFDDKDTITITLADAELASPYGYSFYTFTACVPAPWVSLGMCTYTEDIITSPYGIKSVSYEVELQENETYPGYYRLVNPYGEPFPYNEPGDYDDSKDYYLYIHAEDPNFVYIDRHDFLLNWGDGEIGVISYPSYYVENGYEMDNVKQKVPELFGKLANGEITFPANSLLWMLNGEVYNYANTNGKFSVLMPGVEKKDYSTLATYTGIFTDVAGNSYACATLALGDDVVADATALATVQPAEYDATAVADALASGDLPGTEVSAGTIQVPFDVQEMSGQLQLIIAVVVNGEVKSCEATLFEYYGGGGDANPWKSIGTGIYVDDIFCPMFYADETQTTTLEPIEYEVEVLENRDNPGVYRVMNPYGPGVYPYYDAFKQWGISLPAAGKYLEIDASDPEGVNIFDQDLYFDWGEGSMGFVTYGSYLLANGYYSKDVLKQYQALGVVKDGVIVLPSFYIYDENDQKTEDVHQGYITIGGQLKSYAGLNSSIGLALPSAVSASRIKQVRSVAQRREFESKLYGRKPVMKATFKNARFLKNEKAQIKF